MKLLVLAFTLLLISFTTSNGKADWKFIGDKWVSYGVDHDVIHLGDIKDEFRQLKIRVTDAPLRIADLKVHFDNGSVQDVAIRSNIKPGGESRVIDLDGGLRRLDKLEFWYSTIGKAKGKARVAVWGRK